MIEAKSLTYSIGGSRILDNVSATIKAGKVTAILGPNGAGKSTLLKCLTGAVKACSGSITLDDKQLANYSLNELAKKRAVLSQANPINFPFTALEIVMMGRNPYAASADTDIAQEALQSVDAWHLKDRVFPTLSGGEQQRIQLARVLAQLWEQKDAYLFLDEPTSALDLKHQHQICGLARSMAENRNMAVCIIMHDLHLAMQYADNTILMKGGKVFESGETKDILTPQNISKVFEVPSELVFSEIQRKKAA